MGKKRIKVIEETEQPKSPKSARIKSGKADEARLADMGQKALAELEEIKKKEKELEKEVIKKAKKSQPKAGRPLAEKVRPPKVRSKRYQTINKNIKRDKKYSLEEALQLVKKAATVSFDESVEIHLVVKDKLSGSVTLPYGSGKKQKVAIVDPSPPAGGEGQVDALLKKIESGALDFDILIATPQAMPKLARVAKILGPKGLMPNPKAGTISDKPEELKKKLEGGQIRFKTEPKALLIHLTIGKISFGEEKLLKNLKAFLKAVGPGNILKASLCSTMGPGIKLDLGS